MKMYTMISKGMVIGVLVAFLFVGNIFAGGGLEGTS